MQLKPVHLARLAIGSVLLANLSAAIPYLLSPGRYVAAFEVQGAAGEALVRGLGVLFLMWNATYPPVLLRPDRQRVLFAVILAQQLIAILGEAWIATTLPCGHHALRASGARFLAFDIAGLVAMGLAYRLLHGRRPPSQD